MATPLTVSAFAPFAGMATLLRCARGVDDAAGPGSAGRRARGGWVRRGLHRLRIWGEGGPTGTREGARDAAAGDTLVVWQLDRLGRSVRDLITTVTDLNSAGIAFQSLTEGIDTTSTGRFMLPILPGLAEMERELVRERHRLPGAVASGESSHAHRRVAGERATREPAQRRSTACPRTFRPVPPVPPITRTSRRHRFVVVAGANVAATTLPCCDGREHQRCTDHPGGQDEDSAQQPVVVEVGRAA